MLMPEVVHLCQVGGWRSCLEEDIRPQIMPTLVRFRIFYGESDILEISTPKAHRFIYVLNIKLNRKEGIFDENQRLLYHIVDSSLFLEDFNQI